MNEEQSEVVACAFGGCRNIVTEDDFCHGCERYVCDAHSPFMTLGGHSVEAHWHQDADGDE